MQKQPFKEKPRVLTVIHQPTYAVVALRLLDGKEHRKPPASFIKKREIQSNKSLTRLKNAVSWMLLFSEKKTVYSKAEKKRFSFRLAFITLTLPTDQKHTDNYIKEHMLQPFIYWISRHHDSSYVWKAESQLNGRIHFHITVDTFIHWKSVRAKWNKILTKHHYCKVFQDGTNDHGNAATQIKSVLNETQVARDIGGYMSKKDEVTEKDQKALEENKYDSYEVHCKFNPEKTPAEQNKRWYKRVIDGRLWGCSENLSKIKCFLDETDSGFQEEEKYFFRNNQVENIGKKIIAREKDKFKKIPPVERELRRITDADIEKKYSFLTDVYMHRNLLTMKKGALLNTKITEEKMTRQRNKQKYFTVESFLN